MEASFASNCPSCHFPACVGGAAGAGLGAAHQGAAPLGVTLGLATPRHLASLVSARGSVTRGVKEIL